MNIATLFIFGSLSVFTFSTIMCFAQLNPFYKFYYLFAWYSYIFFIDGIVYLIKKESLIISKTKEFLFMLILSAGWWFLFEIANIFLKNWQYIMLPIDKKERYFGYFFSYATVLPAIFETSEIISSLGFFKNKKIKKIKITYSQKLLFIGICMVLLSLLLPKIFFPLIWVATIPITEYLNKKFGNASLVDDLSNGKGEKIYTLSLAGIICGFLWEILNWKAGAKWIYTLPYLNEPKIFEMPIYGYLGFVFFALECYSFYILILNLKTNINKKIFYPIFIILLFIISFISSILIDKYTVKVFSLI
ncbi:MAG: hypothetical protein N2Z20_00100 [Elusimicrobiales bacterium]|nr:hypothetical protein [Elusimicrobiales bacterium]